MFSVCVPIFNEEENVQRIIDNIRATSLWREPGKKEIILGINGSTDRSVQIALATSERDHQIRVLVLEEKSKNKMWEHMVKASKPESGIIYFVDADVHIEKRALTHLRNAFLTEPTMAIIGARSVPLPEKGMLSIHRKMLVKAMNNLSLVETEGYLLGQCYGIRRRDALTVKLPDDPRIAEDIFLDYHFGRRVKVIADARVHVRMANLFDHFRQRRRGHVWRELFRQKYPEIFKQMKSDPKRRISLQKAKRGFTPSDYFGAFVNQGVERMAGWDAKRLLRTGKDSWPKIKSTKRLSRK